MQSTWRLYHWISAITFGGIAGLLTLIAGEGKLLPWFGWTLAISVAAIVGFVAGKPSQIVRALRFAKTRVHFRFPDIAKHVAAFKAKLISEKGSVAIGCWAIVSSLVFVRYEMSEPDLNWRYAMDLCWGVCSWFIIFLTQSVAAFFLKLFLGEVYEAANETTNTWLIEKSRFLMVYEQVHGISDNTDVRSYWPEDTRFTTMLLAFPTYVVLGTLSVVGLFLWLLVHGLFAAVFFGYSLCRKVGRVLLTVLGILAWCLLVIVAICIEIMSLERYASAVYAVAALVVGALLRDRLGLNLLSSIGCMLPVGIVFGVVAAKITHPLFRCIEDRVSDEHIYRLTSVLLPEKMARDLFASRPPKS